MSYFVYFVSYFYVSFSGLINSVRGERERERELSFLLSFFLQLCGFCSDGFLFLLVLAIGCVI